MESNLHRVLSDRSLSHHGLIDIDDFSFYNSIYGFQQGNELLEQISSFARQYIKAEYWLHIDGDEFLFSTTEEDSQRFKNNIFKFMQVVNSDLGVSVSIGLTETSHLNKPTAILSKLKSNVLLAKKSGKNLLCEL